MSVTIPQAGPGELRRFGITAGGMVAVLFGLLLPWLFERAWPTWPWIVAGALVTTGLLAPAALAPVYRGWMRFGHVIGMINTWIILALTFYVMIFPIGVVMRLLRHDPMRRAPDGHPTSYRVPSQRHGKHHLEKPF